MNESTGLIKDKGMTVLILGVGWEREEGSNREASPRGHEGTDSFRLLEESAAPWEGS